MPFEGAGYEVHPQWRPRDRRYTTTQVARWLAQVFASANAAAPGGKAYLGDISARAGGDASNHRSHASGRDIDIFFMASDRQGQALLGLPAMLHFGSDGLATRWSPPGERPTRSTRPTRPTRSMKDQPLPEARFDARRNWALVRALLENAEVEVQWIFADDGITALLLAEAEREVAPPALVERACSLLHQPTDSKPHTDHMHVRVFCDPGDRPFGCSDKGPKRWLKKHWKYMVPADAVAMVTASASR